MNPSADHDAKAFFENYREALLARNVDLISGMYHCPALIAFPEQTIAVTDPTQTHDFFTNAVGQYEQVSDAVATITVLAATDHSIWADVTWDYHGAAPEERLVYQLLASEDGWRIGVLTPA